jgi:protein-L-isoaspartate(D-aspartate) O-methyltransferase
MAIDYQAVRNTMVEQQVRPWEVLDPRVLEAVAAVPRELFVPEAYRTLAYADLPLPLAHGETMMKPVVEGRLLQALGLAPEDEVLEIGTGSGFLTAVLARLARRVVSVDIFPEFVDAARAKLAAENLRNVELRTADALSLEFAGRFDAIAVTASVPVLDDSFVRMLLPNGRLFVVVGRAPAMEARLITLNANGDTTSESLFETVLTPLINAERPEPFVL